LGAGAEIKKTRSCMNTIGKKNNSAKSLKLLGVIALSFIIIPCGITGVFAHFTLTYVIPAIFALISFAFSIIILIRYKHISLHFIAGLIVGLLFLASSVVEFGFSAIAQNMSISQEINFFGIIRPSQISHGLANIGIGLATIFINWGNATVKKLPDGNTQMQNQKIASIILVVFGILFLIFGFDMLVNGLQPL
jgi:hypothetical protein